MIKKNDTAQINSKGKEWIDFVQSRKQLRELKEKELDESVVDRFIKNPIKFFNNWVMKEDL
jgi:hypothetical protein